MFATLAEAMSNLFHSMIHKSIWNNIKKTISLASIYRHRVHVQQKEKKKKIENKLKSDWSSWHTNGGIRMIIREWLNGHFTCLISLLWSRYFCAISFNRARSVKVYRWVHIATRLIPSFWTFQLSPAVRAHILIISLFMVTSERFD